MKTLTKFLIAGGAIVAAGVVLFITGLGLNGWKFTGENYTMESFTAAEQVSRVEVEASSLTVNISYYDGEYALINYPQSSRRNNAVTVYNGKLEITSEIKNTLSVSVNSYSPELTIYLPSGSAVSLDVELDYGVVNIGDGTYNTVDISLNAGTVNTGYVACNLLDIEVSAGEVTVSKADCAASNIEVNAGSLTATFTENKADYTIRSDVCLGSCNITDQTGSTGRYINIEVNLGSVEIYFEG